MVSFFVLECFLLVYICEGGIEDVDIVEVEYNEVFFSFD